MRMRRHSRRGTDTYALKWLTWHRYWLLVDQTKRRGKCSFEEARKILHRKVQRSFTPNEWADDRVCRFMREYAKIDPRSRVFSINELPADLGFDIDLIPAGASLEMFVLFLPYHCKSQLPFWLVRKDRFDLLNGLLDDPIYGGEARFEKDSHETSARHEELEKKRKKELHPNLQKLQKIGDGFRWICSMMYPWVHPNHNIPNCLTVMADGCPEIRWEVMDPEKFTRFRVAEILKSGPTWFAVNQTGMKVDQEMTIKQMVDFMEKSRIADYERVGMVPPTVRKGERR